MKTAENLNQIKDAIDSSEALLLYVSAPNCSVCEALRPKIEKLFKTRFPKIELLRADISQIPQLGGEFSLFGAPAILLFFDSKEYLREGRNLSLSLLEQKTEKLYRLFFD